MTGLKTERATGLEPSRSAARHAGRPLSCGARSVAGILPASVMIVCFGDLTFDSGSRQLSRGGREVHLSLKAFDLLKVLLERRPEAISKADLHAHLWPDTFVSETNLPSLVKEIRTAIGDAAHESRFVRTVHGFGYAFCGHACEASGPSATQPPAAFALIWEGRRIPLSEGENIVGRDDDAAVSFDSPTLSRRHCCIRIVGSEVTVEDLGSKNGTYVRDARLHSAAALVNGDRIRVGSFVLTLRAVGRDVSTQTEMAEKTPRRSRSRP
jgi:DNA-binding winged helix-turn-helix (wHTH) protein